MGVRSFVSFEADFPTEGTPPGRELASFLATALRGADLPFEDPRNREGWAWNLRANVGKVRIESIVGLTDDGPVQWQVHSSSPTGAFGWLPNQRKARDESLSVVSAALHKVLVSDPRFRSIRWYDPEVFASDHGATWTETP